MTLKGPKKIGKPADRNDKFDVNVVSLEEIIGKEQEEKPKMHVTNSDSISSPLSTQLQEGMSIKVYDGGNPNKKIEKTDEER